LFDLNDLIQLHLLRLFLENLFCCQLKSLLFSQLDHFLRLLRLFKKLENSFSYQLESLLFLSFDLHLDLQLRHLQARFFARHLLEICSDSSLKSLLFSQSLRFSLQSLSHLLDCLLEMLEIYVENSSKDSLFLRLVSHRVSISLMTHLMTHLVAHLATHQLEILVERSLKISLFSRLDHLLESLLVIHLLSHSLFSHLMTHLQEPSLVTRFEAHLVTHLLSRVYS